ncbi:Hypothetical protein PHPALM_6503 [Phytophthora palmivora]|uniref:Uncharacterized protein n=1 Tax=Phytophthora palmivora TaxID=4796 RepID=A0A2P4YEQ0_9STRA|nr:Hypothetical protein PHPALM_6503 [Phytophthora palmivora]
MHSPQHEDEAVQLRQRLRHLEQENDDLQSCVRRLEATKEDLSHKLECTQEEAVFVQQELDILKEKHEQTASESASQICDLTTKIQVYENVLNRLLTVVGIPNLPHETGGKELELELSNAEADDSGEGARQDGGNNFVMNGGTDEVTRTATATPAAPEQKWINLMDHLRDDLKTKTEQLQLTENSYEEFMTISYEVEKALVNDNEALKRLNEELQAKNEQLLNLLQTKPNSTPN